MALTEYEKIPREELPKGWFESLATTYTAELTEPPLTPKSIGRIVDTLRDNNYGIRMRFEGSADFEEKCQLLSQLKTVLPNVHVHSQWILNETQDGVVGLDIYLTATL